MDASCVATGFKLTLDWRACADGDLYDLLARSGFCFVEFATGACLRDDEVALLTAEARACAASGLAVAIHPYLGGAHNPGWFGCRPEARAAMDAFLTAASLAAEVTGAPVLINLHPAELQYEADGADRAALRADLLERSRLYFAEIERRLAACQGRLHVVAEHQLPTGEGEPTIRIGDTCAELLQSVAGTSLGLCWDTGHYIIGVARYGQPDPPPEEFLSRVRHVHLHDVVRGVDHRVVGAGSARVLGYLQLLERRGFAGTVTLEYAWEAILAAGGPEKVIREAAEALEGAVRGLPRATPGRRC